MSGLTIPTGGVNPGRGFQAQPVEVDQTGEMLAQLGDTMAAVGVAVEKDRLDREMQRHQVDLTKDVNDLVLEAEQIGDPDAAEAHWQSGVQALQSRYMQPGPEGRPRVSKRNQERFQLQFDDLTNAASVGLGRRFIGQRRAQREGNYIDLVDQTIRSAAAAPPELRGQMMETVYQQIDELVAAGVINEAEAARRRIAVRGDMSSSLEASYLASVHETVRNAAIAPPEARAEMIADVDRQIDELVAVGAIDAAEAEKRRIDLRGDISRARAADLLENDPEGFLTEDLEGGFEGMDGNTLATYRAMAEAGLKARHKEFITEQKRVQKQREIEVKAELNDMRDIMLAGQPVAEIARLDDPEYQAHPQYAETMAAYSLFVERENIFAMTTDELDDLIQQEKSRKLKHKYQLERLELLDKVRADHQRGYGADPIAYQRQINPKSITDLPDFTTDTAPDFAAALRARRVDAEQLVEQGHVKADVVRLFDDEELARLQRQMAVDKDPEDRLALAAILANELGEGGTADRLTAVVDDPVLAHVAAMAWRGGSKATALETLRGQQMIEANNVTLPPAAERLGATYGLIEDLFADVPAGEASLSAAIGAADALYARRTGRTEVGGEIDERAYKQALHAVMGGTGEFNSGDATGGVQEVRGQMTMLPVGIRASAVESALEMLGHEELPRDERAARGRGASLAYNPDLAAEHWRAASGGQVPQINGEPIAPETLDSLYLMAVGEDRFVALADTRSGKRVVYNEAGAPFVFSLRRLIRETGGGQ